MTRTAIAYLRTELERRIAAEGLRPFAKAIDVPLEQIRSIVSGRSPRSSTIEKVTEALGLEFYIGPPRQSSGLAAPPTPEWTILGARQAPHRGIESCSGTGWGKDVPKRGPLPLPQAVGDNNAFWVTATGAWMVPEGIASGGLCLVSPAAQPVPGDRVWLRDTSGAASIKRLVSIEDDGALHLSNWRNEPGDQPQIFQEKRFPADIERVYPVVAVFNGKPGTQRFEHVPDPKVSSDTLSAAPPELIATLDLPQGLSMAEAIRTIQERLKHKDGAAELASETTTQIEALRKEMKAEIADAKFAVRESLADATALAASHDAVPPQARPVDVVELDAAAGGGSKVLSEEVSGRLWFRREWLDEHGLDAARCAVIGVMGDAMEPTLMEGAKILIDRERTDRQTGDVFVIQTPEGLVVRRAGEDADGHALMLSDNPACENAAWPDEAAILGRVVWTARTLVGE